MQRMRPNDKTRNLLAMVRECMSETTFLRIARQTGLNPSHLYRAFGSNGNPCVSTFFHVCDALNLDVTLVPREPKEQDAEPAAEAPHELAATEEPAEAATETVTEQA